VYHPPFIARERELAVLDREWQAPGARLLILFGRRRNGKTRLITHWMKTSGVRALYWVADPTTAADQLRSFSQALYNFQNPGSPAPAEFTFADWRQAFQQIAQLARESRLALTIDEFTYVAAVQPGIAGLLQNAWDHVLSETDLLLVIAGSHLGMMHRHVLDASAPLYGRSTAQLKLGPLPFGETRRFYASYSAVERVELYAMLGGVPGYWARFRPSRSLTENVREQMLGDGGLVTDEPRLLLQDFLSDVHNYVGIFRAIAQGQRTPTEIATRIGLKAQHVSPYLDKLIEAGYVERRTPVTGPVKTRQGRHHVSDPFLRFYFRFLSNRLDQLALGVTDQLVAEVRRHLMDFIGTHTWEELSREWLLRAGARGQLPFLPDQVGSTWDRNAQIDVVGINWMEHTLYLGECKWLKVPADADVLQKLVAEKAPRFVPAEGDWRVFLLGFSRSGWTEAAAHFARQARHQAPAGGNWHIAGARLIDLPQLDQDLEVWSRASAHPT
jgi:AAA+ ATPase superfamily predicted ATPase